MKEVYGELLVPLLKDLPAIKSLSLELGARYSDYNTAGGVTTWKALTNWGVNSLRRVPRRYPGGHARAERRGAVHRPDA